MNVDLAKRRRVMQRSMNLGHCVCDPRRPCPCAGERPDPIDPSGVKLTQLVRNAGCASKIAPADLEAVLNRLPKVDDPAVLSGIAAGDDAGIYQLTDDVTLVQTVDVFTPCVDDPYTFGRICAANCLSDIYAMGATPRTALSILGFPSESLDGRIMYHMLKGAMDVLAQAKVALIGGHSIKDDEIKLGFAITGTIRKGQAVEHGTARVGDVLVLTKPLGTGVLNFAQQVGRADGADFAAAERSMGELNAAAAEAMRAVGASACTDVTGFGLLGHLVSMVRHSRVTARIFAQSLPAFGGAVELLRQGVVPGAVERNREYAGDDLVVAEGVDAALVDLGFDAQTSGGLLICVRPENHAALLAGLADRGVTGWTIGEVVAESNGRIEMVAGRRGAETPREEEGRGERGEGRCGGAETQREEEGRGERGDGRCGDAETRREEATREGGRLAAELAPRVEAASSPLRDSLRVSDNAPCCSSQAAPQSAPSCCAGGAGAAPTDEARPAQSTSAQSARAFGQLMRETNQDGAIDARTKLLVNFALAVAARCGPCVQGLAEKARKTGISREELDEAAWCAITMNGAPVRMFYDEAMEKAEGGKSCC